MPQVLDPPPPPAATRRSSLGGLKAENAAATSSAIYSTDLPQFDPSGGTSVPVQDQQAVLASYQESLQTTAKINTGGGSPSTEISYASLKKKQETQALPPPPQDLSQSLAPLIGMMGFRFTRANAQIKYALNAKPQQGHGDKLKGTESDCSGWTAACVPAIMQKINDYFGARIYDVGTIGKALRASAAEQFTAIAKRVEAFSSEDIKLGNVPAGTLIAVCNKVIPKFALGRDLGISHVGMVVEDKDGKKYISESASKGVSLTSLDKWIQRYRHSGAKLYAVNPFALTETNTLDLTSAAIKSPTQVAMNTQMPKSLPTLTV